MCCRISEFHSNFGISCRRKSILINFCLRVIWHIENKNVWPVIKLKAYSWMLIFKHDLVSTATFKKVGESELVVGFLFFFFFFWSLAEIFPDGSCNENWMLSFVDSSWATDMHMILLNSSAPFNMHTSTGGLNSYISLAKQWSKIS